MYRMTRELLPAVLSRLLQMGSDIHSHFTRGYKCYRSIFARSNSQRLFIKFTRPKVFYSIPLCIKQAISIRLFKKSLCELLLLANPSVFG